MMDQARVFYSLPLRSPPTFGQHQHFGTEVAHVFTATIGICIGFLPLPCWGCEKFSIDCFRPTSPTVSPWKLLARAEKQQPQSTATFPASTLAGVPLRTASTLPTFAGAPASGSSGLRAAAAPLPSWDANHAAGDLPAGATAAAFLKGREELREGAKKKKKERKSEQMSFLLCLA